MSDEAAPLRGFYYALCSEDAVRPGSVQRVLLNDQPIALARRGDGSFFAVRDVCPHRGAPFSAGKVCADGTLECPYHGWRFGASGACTRIPALGPDDAAAAASIRVAAHAIVQRHGVVWAYLPVDREPPPPFALPVPDLDMDALGAPLLHQTVAVNCGIDEACIGLMDPAHGPFVHRSFFWRNEASIHRKRKAFAPAAGPGFVMQRHAPSRNAAAYKILGGTPDTQITFLLPGLRIEEIRIGARRVIGLTTITPRGANTCDLMQVFYTDVRWLKPLRPLLRWAVRHFLQQDADIINQQARNRAYAPRMMLLEGADTQARWYYKLKRVYRMAQAEGREFINPVPETELVWYS